MRYLGVVNFLAIFRQRVKRNGGEGLCSLLTITPGPFQYLIKKANRSLILAPFDLMQLGRLFRAVNKYGQNLP
jgi:hypothetical protein